MDRTKDVPEWALKRAAELTGELCGYDIAPQQSHYGTAFARYIAEHEEAAVDPLLLEAREVCAIVMDAHVGEYFSAQARFYRDGSHDDEPEITKVMDHLTKEQQP